MSAIERFYSRAGLVEREMERLVPRAGQPAEVYGLLWEFLDLGGKRFRPLLALASSRACGGRDSDTLPAAAAIELFHNFTLIHDDIEDDSQMRRGKPCLHIRHGVPLALNAGDGLFMLVWRAALSIKSPRSAAVQKAMLDAFTAVLEGQAKELGWHRRHAWDLSAEDYLSMVGGKTAALVQASCSVGALCASAKPAQVKALASYGHSMGVAFQIQDDVLNLVGEEAKYKKEIGGDIREGKRTLMVLHALPRLGAPDAKRLRSILDSQSAGQSDIDWAIGRMRSAGSIDYASNYARSLVKKSLGQLSKLPKSEAREELEAVAKFITERES
ncbi:MAG: polyprenyl synthetase family protein [Candidatus Marsarchaeota archaeon]|nr:polyprenyl synthetase family protein [Candidatus Marsarchaeota archaeon]